MLQKKQETLAFFREMEDNIRRKIAVAQNQQDETVASSNFSNLYYSLNSSDGLSYLDSGEAMYRDDGKEGRSRLCSVGSNDGSTGTKSLAGSYDGNRPRLNSYVPPPRRIRTISTLDGMLFLYIDRRLSPHPLPLFQTRIC